MANSMAALNVSTVLSRSRATTAHLKAQAARDQLHLSEVGEGRDDLSQHGRYMGTMVAMVAA